MGRISVKSLRTVFVESGARQVFPVSLQHARVFCLSALCLVAQACGGPDSAGARDAGTGGASAEMAAPEITWKPAQFSWQTPPAQVAAKEGFVDVGGARLWYWDTGGEGEAVVFSHPFSGSALTWEYQQPFFAEEGYRVIAYSRRGHYRTEILDSDSTNTATDDLLKLVDHLGVDRFHIVALAAGAHIAPDFATSYPDRLLSLVVGCTIGLTGDPEFTATNDTLMPPEFSSLPVWLKEISSFYRGANPEGTIAWTAISDLARPGERVNVALNNEFTPGLLAAIDHPALLFTGDGDYYMPPSRLRSYAAYWTDPEVVVFRGAGHAPYWEQPLAFNQTLLDFFRRNGK